MLFCKSGRSLNHFLPSYESLEHFWSCIGQIPLPAGEVREKRFGNLANFCKLLLVLPHSTADPERLFSIIGKIDTSQRSSLLPRTVCNILSVKLNVGYRTIYTSTTTGKNCHSI